jgi:hypothetical protein
MSPKPYTQSEFDGILLKCPKPHTPNVLHVMLQAREYESLEDLFKDWLVQDIAKINHIHRNWNPHGFVEDWRKGEPLIDLDRLIATKFTNEYLEEIVQLQWSNVEFHYNLKPWWVYIFSKVSFNKGNIPEGEFTIYRAGTKDGLAWTMNIEKARHFHNRNEMFFKSKPEHNNFMKMNVTKEDVLFYENGRDEEEVVLFPNQDKIVTINV